MKINQDIINTMNDQIVDELAVVIINGFAIQKHGSTDYKDVPNVREFIEELVEKLDATYCHPCMKDVVFGGITWTEKSKKEFPFFFHNITYNRVELFEDLDYNYIAECIILKYNDLAYKTC